MVTVYILQSSKTGRYYVGITDNIEKRLTQHNAGKNRSTRHGTPWKLIHSEEYESRPKAMEQETRIKARGIRRYLEKTIAQLG
jgi:putative endonuclease